MNTKENLKEMHQGGGAWTGRAVAIVLAGLIFFTNVSSAGAESNLGYDAEFVAPFAGPDCAAEVNASVPILAWIANISNFLTVSPAPFRIRLLCSEPGGIKEQIGGDVRLDLSRNGDAKQADFDYTPAVAGVHACEIRIRNYYLDNHTFASHHFTVSATAPANDPDPTPPAIIAYSPRDDRPEFDAGDFKFRVDAEIEVGELDSAFWCAAGNCRTYSLSGTSGRTAHEFTISNPGAYSVSVVVQSADGLTATHYWALTIRPLDDEPDPTPDPTPEPDPTPDPDPEPIPEPEPTPDPEPEPEPEPGVYEVAEDALEIQSFIAGAGAAAIAGSDGGFLGILAKYDLPQVATNFKAWMDGLTEESFHTSAKGADKIGLDGKLPHGTKVTSETILWRNGDIRIKGRVWKYPEVPGVGRGLFETEVIFENRGLGGWRLKAVLPRNIFLPENYRVLSGQERVKMIRAVDWSKPAGSYLKKLPDGTFRLSTVVGRAGNLVVYPDIEIKTWDDMKRLLEKPASLEKSFPLKKLLVFDRPFMSLKDMKAGVIGWLDELTAVEIPKSKYITSGTALKVLRGGGRLLKFAGLVGTVLMVADVIYVWHNEGFTAAVVQATIDGVSIAAGTVISGAVIFACTTTGPACPVTGTIAGVIAAAYFYNQLSKFEQEIRVYVEGFGDIVLKGETWSEIESELVHLKSLGLEGLPASLSPTFVEGEGQLTAQSLPASAIPNSDDFSVIGNPVQVEAGAFPGTLSTRAASSSIRVTFPVAATLASDPMILRWDPATGDFIPVPKSATASQKGLVTAIVPGPQYPGARVVYFPAVSAQPSTEERVGTSLTYASVYPLPFDSRSGRATIKFVLGADTAVTIRIFDLFGGAVRQMNFAAGQPGGRRGENLVAWDGTADDSRKVSKGVYVVDIRAGGDHAVRKAAVIH